MPKNTTAHIAGVVTVDRVVWVAEGDGVPKQPDLQWPTRLSPQGREWVNNGD